MKTIIASEYKIIVEKERCQFIFDLKNPHVEKFFNLANPEKINSWQNKGMDDYLIKEIDKYKSEFTDIKINDLNVNDFKLTLDCNIYNEAFIKFICEKIRHYYELREMHITRMFGSYILIRKCGGVLKAVMATPIPIKYCPLMIKLLKEVGGENAEAILETLKTDDTKKQQKMMCKLINEIVIKGGYFDTNRPLNSCEANVLFGASETMSSALNSGIIDCSVIVSNNLGTIITTNASNTQGAVKRMTGLFYSSPSKKLIKTALDSKIIPVFPYTANIDQLKGVKEAIKLGYQKIAVSVASHDNYLHKQLKALENEKIKIYKFGLCSTGISKNTALVMSKNADVVWSCASKYVKEYIEPNSIAQVGIKIPVHILTKNGYDIIYNHLKQLDNSLPEIDISKNNSSNKPVFLNSKGKIKVINKSELHSCLDCPHPCI